MKKYVFKCLMNVSIVAKTKEEAYEKFYDSERDKNPDVEIYLDEMLDVMEINEKQES